MKRLFITAMLLPLAGLFILGQNPAIVTVRVVTSVEILKPGQSYPLALEVGIHAPYHINADQPLEEYLVGTTVDFKAPAGVTFRKVTFPPAKMKKLEFAEKPLAVYEGVIRITAEVALAPDFQGKELTIEGILGYQACDDRSCLPPTNVPFSRKMAVSGGTETAAPETRETAKIEGNAAREVEKASGSFEDKGLLLMFLMVFLGGLALNLTPCVYPLIPITISYFGGQSRGKKGSVVAHSIIYIIGMAVTYSLLGVVAAFTGSLFGAALQYPPVLVAIALIMVVLALSMFDVFELRMPAFLNKLAGGSRKGLFGTFFMGLTVGIVAAPCIGPFVLGLLTYVGEKGSVFLGFSLFFVLALGLGIPFFLLGIFSGSINRLPRSGAWMVWVRKIFGFILIAMAVYFLKTLFPNALFYHLALALTMLVAGLYLAWIEPTKTSGKAFPYVRNICGVIFFTLALYIAATGVQAYLDDEISAKLQSRSSTAGVKADAITWSPYSEEKLAAAAREGKPVLIDFYADWCLPCKELDKLTFTDPAVIAASKEFVMIKADLTSAQDPTVKALTRKFGVKGVPTLLFLMPDGKEIFDLRVTGFERKGVFLPKMKRALALNGK